MTIRTEAVDAETLLVAVAGDVTFSNVERLARALRVDARHLVIDLTDVDFVDSSGLAALLRASAAARERGGSIALVHAGEPPSIFRFRGVERLLALHGSRADALADTRSSRAR
jgi:anti-sigma B factor antagonist